MLKTGRPVYFCLKPCRDARVEGAGLLAKPVPECRGYKCSHCEKALWDGLPSLCLSVEAISAVTVRKPCGTVCNNQVSSG